MIVTGWPVTGTCRGCVWGVTMHAAKVACIQRKSQHYNRGTEEENPDQGANWLLVPLHTGCDHYERGIRRWNKDRSD